ncbi:hypothetical protein B0H34DRAFT_728237 [Crassisporium funariophilum]|nr:hypothetical protein B0H34DRAFT_728237 [Crassisporium funariophilum]
MSSAYTTNPPTYDEPSAADELLSIQATALAVQQGIFNAKMGVERVDNVARAQLKSRLDQIDNNYLKLLNESRNSANKLYSEITNFIAVALPIAKDQSYPLVKRVKSVKGAADKIARAGKQDLRPYDKQVEILRKDLQGLREALTAADMRLKKDAQGPLRDLTAQVSAIEQHLKKNKKITDRLSATSKELIATFKKPAVKPKDPAPVTTPSEEPEAPISAASAESATPADGDKPEGKKEENKASAGTMFFSAVKTIGAFFETEAALKAKESELDDKVRELVGLRTNIDKTSAEIDAVIVEITDLLKLFSGIVGKLGHFSVIWEKLENDSAELSEYLAAGGDDEEAFLEKVESEAGVYDSIRLALDEYCLRV